MTTDYDANIDYDSTIDFDGAVGDGDQAYRGFIANVGRMMRVGCALIIAGIGGFLHDFTG